MNPSRITWILCGAAWLVPLDSAAAQTCYEAPTPNSAYRGVWQPDVVPLPGAARDVRGLAWDGSGSRLWIHTGQSLLEFAAVRDARGALQSLIRTARAPVASPLPGAARSLAVVGNRAYVVGRPRNVNTLYELDLQGTGGWVAHAVGMAGVRLHAVMADRSPVVGSGNPDGLLLVDRPGKLWQLSAQRVGGNPLSGVSTTAIGGQSIAVGFGQWQPMFVPRGEPGFSSTRRSVLAAREPSSGQNSEIRVFECSVPGSQPALRDWVPVRASGAGDFAFGGNCRGAARDPRTGDLLLLMNAIYDGFAMHAVAGLFVFRRGQTANGCTIASVGGSGQAPFPSVATRGTALQLGGRLAYEISGAPPGAVGVLMIGGRPSVGTVRVGPQVLFVMIHVAVPLGVRADSGGRVALGAVPIPPQANFVNARVFAQSAFLLAGAGRFTLSGVARTVIR